MKVFLKKFLQKIVEDDFTKVFIIMTCIFFLFASGVVASFLLI